MKTVQNWEQLDQEICDWIASNQIGHPANSLSLQKVAVCFCGSGEPWRLIDRRMQAMRRSGRIKYVGRRKDRHGWVVFPH